jgi:hypothetical protein
VEQEPAQRAAPNLAPPLVGNDASHLLDSLPIPITMQVTLRSTQALTIARLGEVAKFFAQLEATECGEVPRTQVGQGRMCSLPGGLWPRRES